MLLKVTTFGGNRIYRIVLKQRLAAPHCNGKNDFDIDSTTTRTPLRNTLKDRNGLPQVMRKDKGVSFLFVQMEVD